MEAEVLAAGDAEPAVAAGRREPAYADGITDGVSGDAGAEGGDAAGGLVAEGEGQACGDLAFRYVKVSAADAAGGDVDEDLAGAGDGIGQVLACE